MSNNRSGGSASHARFREKHKAESKDLQSEILERQKGLYAGKPVITGIPVEQMLKEEMDSGLDCVQPMLQILEHLFPFEVVDYFYTECSEASLFQTKDGEPLFQGDLTWDSYCETMAALAEQIGLDYGQRIRQEQEEERKLALAREEERRKEQAQKAKERQDRQKNFKRFMRWTGIIVVSILILTFTGKVLYEDVLLPKINMSTLETAIEHIENNEIEEAETCFNKLGNFDDWSKELQDAYYTEYDNQYEAGNYDYLIRLTETGLPRDREKVCSIYAEKGKAAEEKKQYKKAAEAYDKAFSNGVGQYQYLEDRNRCYYLRAVNLYKDKKYLKAIEAFKIVPQYKDSPTYIKKCHYQRGLIFFKNAKYENAEHEFFEAGDYKSSKSYMALCEALYWKQHGSPYLAYSLLNDVSKSFEPARKYFNQKWYVLLSELEGSKWTGTYPADEGYSHYFYFEFGDGCMAMEQVYNRFRGWDDLYKYAEYAYPTYKLDEIKMEKGNLLHFEDYDDFIQIKDYDGHSLQVRYYRQRPSDDYPTEEYIINLTRF